MAKEKNFNLISGLFQQPQQNRQDKQVEQAEQVQKDKITPAATKRTFAINNEYWADFLDLAAARKLTQAGLLNKLIEYAVKENTNEIAKYREFFGK